MNEPRRRLVIVDPSTAPTGALRGAANIARAASPWAETILVLSTQSQIAPQDVIAFDRVVYIPMRQIRRSWSDLTLYGPTLVIGSVRLSRLLPPGSTLVVNDYYLLHGFLMRLLTRRVRILAWVRADPFSFPKPLSKLWLSAMRVSADAVVAVSDFIVTQLRPWKIKSVRVYDPFVSPGPARMRRGDAGQRIVQVANFTRGKGQDDAISAFDRIAPEFPEAHLALYGGDLGLQRNRDYLEDLKRQAAATSVRDRISFHEFTHDVGSVLAGAAVALMLSHRESFSLSCLEASGCGLPVIATRCGGPEEIVEDGVTGLLCDVGDVLAIAGAMERLLRDPPTAVRMGARGAALVKRRFSPDTFGTLVRGLLFPATRVT